MIYAVNKRTKEHKLTNLSEYNMNMYPHSQYKIIEADADGWIEWSGGECPLPDGIEYEFICHNGEQGRLKNPEEDNWDGKYGEGIAFYRPILARPVLNDKPQWVPEVGARCEVTHGEAWREALYLGIDIFGNYAYQLADGEFMGEFNGAPSIQDFRPLPTEEDRAVEEMYRDAQLAGCVGFTQGMATALYRAGYRKQPTEDTDDRTHWANKATLAD